MRSLGPLVLVTACGGSASNPPIVLVDAMHVDSSAAPDASHTTTISIFTFGVPPALLALRDGAGPWTALDPTADTFTVTQPLYQLLAVCAEDTAFRTAIAAQAAADGQVKMPCYVQPPVTPPTPVAITGHMAQPGTVWLGGSTTGTTSPWTYTLDVAPGKHSFIAADAAKIAIQRNLTISTAGAGPDVDVEQTGTPFDHTAFTLVNAVTSAVMTNDLQWITANNDFADVSSTGTTVPSIPAALFDGSDIEVLILTATDGLKLQQAQEVAFGGTPNFEPSVALLPELVGMTFSGPSALWSTLPTGFDSAALEVIDPNGNTEVITATPTWLAGASSLAIDLTAVPSYQAAWRVGMTGATHQFSITKNLSQITSVLSFVSDTAAFTGTKRAALQRARRSRGLGH